MNFIQKLTEDTKSGLWDYEWKYSDGAKSYTFVKQKHYLNGLTFSLDKDKVAMIFPNGVRVVFGESVLVGLRDSVVESLERTVRDSMDRYVSGEVVVEEDSGDGENTITDTKSKDNNDGDSGKDKLNSNKEEIK